MIIIFGVIVFCFLGYFGIGKVLCLILQYWFDWSSF